MKTRSDFVSNSSSCSFIINDVQAGLHALEELDILDLDDMCGITVSFKLYEDIFNKLGMSRLETWRDDRTKEVFCRCEPSELLQLPKLALDNLSDLEFSCDDYEQQSVLILSLMLTVLHIRGIDADDENSEMSLISVYNKKCAASKLLNYIFNSKKEANEIYNSKIF